MRLGGRFQKGRTCGHFLSIAECNQATEKLGQENKLGQQESRRRNKSSEQNLLMERVSEETSGSRFPGGKESGFSSALEGIEGPPKAKDPRDEMEYTVHRILPRISGRALGQTTVSRVG